VYDAIGCLLDPRSLYNPRVLSPVQSFHRPQHQEGIGFLLFVILVMEDDSCLLFIIRSNEVVR
jgi:hypothetical protein